MCRNSHISAFRISSLLCFAIQIAALTAILLQSRINFLMFPSFRNFEMKMKFGHLVELLLCLHACNKFLSEPFYFLFTTNIFLYLISNFLGCISNVFENESPQWNFTELKGFEKHTLSQYQE